MEIKANENTTIQAFAKDLLMVHASTGKEVLGELDGIKIKVDSSSSLQSIQQEYEEQAYAHHAEQQQGHSWSNFNEPQDPFGPDFFGNGGHQNTSFIDAGVGILAAILTEFSKGPVQEIPEPPQEETEPEFATGIPAGYGAAFGTVECESKEDEARLLGIYNNLMSLVAQNVMCPQEAMNRFVNVVENTPNTNMKMFRPM